MDELLFTPAAVLELLSNIDELRGVDVGIVETLSNELQITVGSSSYIISADNATTIEVDEDALESIDEANIDTYERLSESGEVDVDISTDGHQNVEGSIIKELAKTLLIGGMVRLTDKLLGNRKK